MERTSVTHKPRRRRRLLIFGALLLVFGLAIFGAWLAAPFVAKNMLHKQFARAEGRTGIAFHTSRVETAGLRTLKLEDLQLTHPTTEEPLGTIALIEIEIDPWKSLRGSPVVKALSLQGIHFNIHRGADGKSLFDELRPGNTPDDDPLSTDDESSPEQASHISIKDRVEQALRHFGGTYPDVIAEDLSLTFTSDSEPWPLTSLSSDRFTLTAGADNAPFEALITVDASPATSLQLPDRIEISGTLKTPAHRSTLDVIMEPPLRIADLPHLPFLAVSASGFSIGDDYTLQITSPRLSTFFGESPEPLIGAERVQAQLRGWERDPRHLSLIGFEVDALRVFLNYHEEGASNLGELLSIIRRSAAKDTLSRARHVARAIHARQQPASDATDTTQADTSNPSPSSDLSKLPIRQWLTNYLPESTTLRDFRLVVDDARTHENLTRPASHFELRGEVITLTHRPVNGILEGELKFQIETEDEVAHTDIHLSIPYRRGDWNAKVDIGKLQLAQFSQLAGPRFARYLQGGEVTATLDITNDGGQQQATRFDGLFAIRELRLHHGSVAEAPIELDSASIQARGFYDPSMPLPPPELIEELPTPAEDDPSLEETPPAANLAENTDQEEEKLPPPTKGALVIETALASLGEVEAAFSLNIHGIENRRLPNRAALRVDLESTPLPALIEAIPAALQGPLNGMRMQGSLEWDFHLEVPFYKARDMRWESVATLSDDFKVLYLPPQVDVFKLFDAFSHTIYDEWKITQHRREREYFYERKIQIPTMRPTPATWLLENTTLTLEEIDKIRRDREWPPVPRWTPDSPFDRELLDSPEYWLTNHALSQAAPRPWKDPAPNVAAQPFWQRWAQLGGQQIENEEDQILRYEEPEPIPYYITEVKVDPDRYGPYVYVPLHHISPYLPRAIMTTEDTSFFTHSGFNFLAIRHSVEANIERGRFHRGASTISMQLAKNLFLNRQRVLSRKLQEVVLVWLMESVAEVPKERMMELYLNIIEYGPGIFGIHEASMHYFGKRPDELTIAEVAWLVSIVPSPKRHHVYYDRGEIPPFWLRRMGRYIRAMHRRDRITEEEMEAALEEIPEFYFPQDGEALLRVYAEQERAQASTASQLIDEPPQESPPALSID